MIIFFTVRQQCLHEAKQENTTSYVISSNLDTGNEKMWHHCKPGVSADSINFLVKKNEKNSNFQNFWHFDIVEKK